LLLVSWIRKLRSSWVRSEELSRELDRIRELFGNPGRSELI